jgi:hypothetical protein
MDTEQDWGNAIPADDLSNCVSKVGEHPVNSGGFGDVYRGIWNVGNVGPDWILDFSMKDKEFAIKVIRPFVMGPQLEKIKRVGLT